NIFLLNSLKFNKNRINRLGGKSTFMEVTKSSLRTFKISLPPLPEQLRIAEIISKVDDTIHKSLDNINKIKALKKMLINQFFNGGLETAVSINPRAKQLYETQVSE
ncbi:MAG: restriction endonuclease subunit S, partial [Proteobacteria bacterium]|nr:restriction endonuclease subunit S [Pseudomonadota bacterium]